jgi:hypothetical protein
MHLVYDDECTVDIEVINDQLNFFLKYLNSLQNI